MVTHICERNGGLGHGGREARKTEEEGVEGRGRTAWGRLMSVQQRRLQQADAAWLRLSAGHQRKCELEGMQEAEGEGEDI